MRKFRERLFMFFNNKTTVYAAVLSVAQTMLSFFLDRFIFTQTARSGLKYLLFKALFLFVIFIVWYFVIDFFKKLFIEKKRYLMIYLKVFSFFFLFYSVLLLLIYPGNWMFDDIGVLSAATVNLSLYALQHILTSVFYILALMTIPLPAGVIILQYTVISAIIAYFIGTLYNLGGRKYLWVSVLFLMPPVLIHVLYPMRLCLFAFLELLFFFIMNKKEKITGYKAQILIIALNVILAVWRTECIFFAIFITMYLIYKKQPIKIIAIATTIVIIGSGILSGMNNYCQGDQDALGYRITGIVRPFHALLLEDYRKNDGQLIEEVHDIVDIDKAVLCEDGETAFWWAYAYDKVDTEDKFQRMVGVYSKLIKKYPKALLKERLDVFHVTQNVLAEDGNIRNIVASGNIYLNHSPQTVPMCKNKDLKFTPINMDLRAKTLLFLYSKGENRIIGKIIRWTYNLIIPIILLMFLLIYSIIKRDGVLTLSVLFLLAQTAAVFVTAPAPLFMYYLPIYVCSYGLLISKMSNILKK